MKTQVSWHSSKIFTRILCVKVLLRRETALNSQDLPCLRSLTSLKNSLRWLTTGLLRRNSTKWWCNNRTWNRLYRQFKTILPRINSSLPTSSSKMPTSKWILAWCKTSRWVSPRANSTNNSSRCLSVWAKRCLSNSNSSSSRWWPSSKLKDNLAINKTFSNKLTLRTYR